MTMAQDNIKLFQFQDWALQCTTHAIISIKDTQLLTKAIRLTVWSHWPSPIQSQIFFPIRLLRKQLKYAETDTLVPIQISDHILMRTVLYCTRSVWTHRYLGEREENLITVGLRYLEWECHSAKVYTNFNILAPPPNPPVPESKKVPLRQLLFTVYFRKAYGIITV